MHNAQLGCASVDCELKKDCALCIVNYELKKWL